MFVNKEDVAPLIVVSNRLPFVLSYNESGILERKPSAGGLVTALGPVVISCKGLWIGWSGLHDLAEGSEIPEPIYEDDTSPSALKSSQVIPVRISKQTFLEFYNGYCNGTLWPVFHSMPEKADFETGTWKAYCLVNEEFGNKTMKALRTTLHACSSNDKQKSQVTPIIWIHDYHLFSVAPKIRKICNKENLRCRIGFFLHIPFPPWETMKLLTRDKEILEGMLACDLIGFHIKDYCLNFLDCCSHRLDCQIYKNEMVVEYDGRLVYVKELPVGIPYEYFDNLARNSLPYIRDSNNVQTLLGVDRLDYTKGIIQRMLALERLLEKYPEYIENVTLLQISVPSRTEVIEYTKLKEEVDRLIEKINSKFSKPNWTPIKYIYGFLKQEELAMLYRNSSVALVTPLKDGMNLVAKEYVACQVDDPGVLILSQFTGAAESMQEALIVNPYYVDNITDAIYEALRMSYSERLNRMMRMKKREKDHDVTYWRNSFLKSLTNIEIKNETISSWEPPLKFMNEKEKLSFFLACETGPAPLCSGDKKKKM